jgi:hypothetical protein
MDISGTGPKTANYLCENLFPNSYDTINILNAAKQLRESNRGHWEYVALLATGKTVWHEPDSGKYEIFERTS